LRKGRPVPETVANYIKDNAPSTCPIAADNDPIAVLDACVNVRKRLRVVDASNIPRILGTFTAVSTYIYCYGEGCGCYLGCACCLIRQWSCVVLSAVCSYIIQYTVIFSRDYAVVQRGLVL
jgi:hypothetical protein